MAILKQLEQGVEVKDLQPSDLHLNEANGSQMDQVYGLLL